MVVQALVVDGVGETYGATRALDNVGFRLDAGRTLAVLGHNGAGKTTLVRVLTTLIVPDGGRVLVGGVDALARPAEVRRRIGVTGQYAGLDEFLTTLENLELVGRLSGLRAAARARAWDLVERFELDAIAARRVGELSGGSRRRVDLAASLVASPDVLFLDEIVAELTAAGTTVVLTTQYLEEADRLADQVLVLDHGRVAGHGTPGELKALVGGKVVRATIPAHGLDSLSHRPDVTTPAGADRVAVSFTLADAAAATTLVGRLTSDAVEVADLEVAAPSLDDVFFHLATSGGPR
jgi:ABC-2 type transport system ATP-binding protein